MATVLRLPGFDHSIALLREGYDFLPRRFERHGTDLLEARLLLQRTICMQGREAAALFYDSSRFRRRRAAPRRARVTLFGRGAVQGLDGQAHLERKAMFMRLMDEVSIGRFVTLFELHWRDALARWQERGRVELLLGAREVLTRTVCEWASVPLPNAEVERRAEQLAAIVEGSGSIGPEHWRARLARLQVNLWIMGVIKGIRAGQLRPPPGSPAYVVAWQREGGKLLSARLAAVELVNLLRPAVAIDRYIGFAGLALHEHGERLATLEPAWSWEDPQDLEAFVQEVRRFYPFFPFAAAKVRKTFEWRGYRFARGRRVLLDIYGSNRDEREWEDPQQFKPERFRGRAIERFVLIPQGGGDHYRDHRCAGEWLTIAVMMAAVRSLTTQMSYRVPEQDLRVDRGRIPTGPADGFVIEDLQSL
ncbi:MAG: cytochrome P450 [Enhygromyxa sp.]